MLFETIIASLSRLQLNIIANYAYKNRKNVIICEIKHDEGGQNQTYRSTLVKRKTAPTVPTATSW